jgi:hypothetical protein
VRLPGLIIVAVLALCALCSAPSLSSGAADARAPTTCGTDSYVNVRGACVHRPIHADRVPRGATARCRDGTYSFSQSRRGTCSWHGGVAAWL